jgi:endogenous inhibitor of DNA gyrase (YacG/DUF329 family)
MTLKMTIKTKPAANVPSCPICGKPSVQPTKPFCSKRCADVDLNRWLSGVYAVPTTEMDDEDGTVAQEESGKDQG